MFRPGALIIVMLAALAAGAATADSTITYQGELRQGGAPVGGAFDMSFRLFDAEIDGTQVGPTLSEPDVPVAGGVFTVELDFGVEGLGAAPGARWLEVTVAGVVVEPRQRIRAAPYALQTLGLDVDGDGSVGIGTPTPEAPLHVASGSAGDVTAHFRSIATFERSGHGYLSLLTPNGSERGLVFGDPDAAREAAVLYNRQTTPDGLEFLNVNASGYGLRMRIDAAGDAEIRGRLGVNASIGSAQVAVAAAGPDPAIDTRSSDDRDATFRASSTAGGPVFRATGTADASHTRDGLLMIGRRDDRNIIFDGNEIMARLNGSPATLHFNVEGGPVRLGPNAVKPPLAYGFVDASGRLVRSSGNVIAWRTDIGRYGLALDEGVRNQDVIIVTACPDHVRQMQAYAFPDYPIDQIFVRTREVGEFYYDCAFSFLIYRP